MTKKGRRLIEVGCRFRVLHVGLKSSSTVLKLRPRIVQARPRPPQILTAIRWRHLRPSLQCVPQESRQTMEGILNIEHLFIILGLLSSAFTPTLNYSSTSQNLPTTSASMQLVHIPFSHSSALSHYRRITSTSLSDAAHPRIYKNMNRFRWRV